MSDDVTWALRPNERLPQAPPLWACVDPKCWMHFLLVKPVTDLDDFAESSWVRPPISPDGAGWALASAPKGKS